MECECSKVHKIVTLALEIIDEISPTIKHSVGRFPYGWCDDCSRVLGILLNE